MKLRFVIGPILMSAFVAGWLVLEVVLWQSSTLLAAYDLEYAGGGSCAWRTNEGKRVQSLLLLLLLLWPLGLATLVTLALRARQKVRARWRLFIAFGAVILILMRIATSDFHRWALELCP